MRTFFGFDIVFVQDAVACAFNRITVLGLYGLRIVDLIQFNDNLQIPIMSCPCFVLVGRIDSRLHCGVVYHVHLPSSRNSY